ncbi:MAG: hypothetical protein ACK493_00950 [Planctomycetota bacterium]
MKELALLPISRTPAVCLGCTLLCDDVTIAISERGEIHCSEQCCARGIDWFLREAAAERQSVASGIRCGGEPATQGAAIQRAAEMILAARSPLICGLTSASLAEQQALVKLALQTGAVIDLDWHAPQTGNLVALQHTGRITATLGQVAAQADLCLLIEAAPERTHPRMGERFAWQRSSGWRFRTDDLSVESAPGLEAPALTELVCSSADELNDLIWWLRAFVRGIGDPAQQCPPGWKEAFDQFLVAVRTARGVAVVGGAALAGQPALALQVHQLVRELNEWCKTWLLLASEDRNAAGAESVLTWSTGFPRCVDLRGNNPDEAPARNGRIGKGEARWSRTEFSAAKLLAGNECDLLICCLTAEEEIAWPNLPTALREALLGLPRIVFYSSDHPLVAGADVAIPVAQVGWDSSGDLIRLDELTLTAPRIIASERLGLEGLVADLLEELG